MDHLSISIDGYNAQIKEPARTFLNMSQNLRSQILEINLILSIPPKDTDSDGLPIINGDINGNGSADLADLILALQICAGKRVGDVYYHKNIGLDNILFLMKKIF